MSKLAVIGLDGLDWSIANNPEEFAWFGTQIHEDKMGLLAIDTYTHTVPSWTLAFTGMDIANELGIKSFKGYRDGEPHWYTSDDVPAPFIWDHMEAEGLKPLRSNWLMLDLKFNGDFKYDCEYIDEDIKEKRDMHDKKWNNAMFEKTPEEIEDVMIRQWKEMWGLIEDNQPDGIFSYFHSPDLAGHIYRNANGSMEDLLQTYHYTEDLTREMSNWLIDHGYNVLYLSDHGLPDGKIQYDGQGIISHKTTGIVGSPTLDLEYPMKMSDIHPLLVDYFGLSKNTEVETEEHEMSDEEEEYVENQLKGMGYL